MKKNYYSKSNSQNFCTHIKDFHNIETNERKCSRCIISELDDPLIIIDDSGICNYCNNYDKQLNELGSKTEKKFIENKINEIKFSRGKIKSMIV